MMPFEYICGCIGIVRAGATTVMNITSGASAEVCQHTTFLAEIEGLERPGLETMGGIPIG